ncbi:sugar ABC transporter ATP-binding protein [Microgenomates group bacterium RBG_16_45_19]|nr:MAG: sugar ABC transporter ATP-binding protein [Microgenomates group bacterium RBG_16_45_19]
MSSPIIVFDHVRKSYPLYQHMKGGTKHLLFHLPNVWRSIKNSTYEVLKDVSFEVKTGEALGIIGRNGAGKSTILGLIAGVLKPSSGKIVVTGRISPLLELGAGFHPELTGRENIILNGIILGLTKTEIIKKLDEIIEFSELGEFIEQPIRVYSSGMLARLGFSVVAHLNPDILLIDEILAVGDLEFQKKCIDKMIGFKKNRVAIIFVSHSISDIVRICDRVLWIENHTIKILGEPPDVVKSYTS